MVVIVVMGVSVVIMMVNVMTVMGIHAPMAQRKVRVCRNVLVMKVKSPKGMLGSVTLMEHGAVKDIYVRLAQMKESA
jgi:hypothetical protein